MQGVHLHGFARLCMALHGLHGFAWLCMALHALLGVTGLVETVARRRSPTIEARLQEAEASQASLTEELQGLGAASHILALSTFCVDNFGTVPGLSLFESCGMWGVRTGKHRKTTLQTY